MSGWTFHPTLVAPFYASLMRAQLLSMPAAEREALWDRFRSRWPEYSEQALREMLASSWRPAKVAAWVIAGGRLEVLLPEVALSLQRQPAHAEHLCLCLARLGGEEARDALVTYLEGYVEGALQTSSTDESGSPEWAVAALELWAHPGLDEAWQTWLDRQLPALRPSWQARLARARQALEEALDLFDGP